MPIEDKCNRPLGKLRGVFSDFGEIGRMAGWDLGFRQLDSGPQVIPASIAMGGRVTVIGMRFNRGFHQMGFPPPGSLSFGIPIEGMTDWFGRPYNDQSVLPFNHVSGVDGVSRQGFAAYTLSISEEFIRGLSDTYQLPMPEYLHSPRSGAFIADSQSVQKLRGALQWLLNDDEAMLGEEQEADLVATLLTSAHAESRIEDKSAPVARSQAVSAALDYLWENQNDAMTVGEICMATGVSWRTLNRAFMERFGVSPKAYLQRLRLAGVRAELLNGQVNTVIADVANQWGFWHMGQFARDYRILFGELPSETLHRRRGQTAIYSRSSVLMNPRASIASSFRGRESVETG